MLHCSEDAKKDYYCKLSNSFHITIEVLKIKTTTENWWRLSHNGMKVKIISEKKKQVTIQWAKPLLQPISFIPAVRQWLVSVYKLSIMTYA